MNDQRCDRCVRLLGLSTLLVASLRLPQFAAGQSARSLTASARCVDAGTGGHPGGEVQLMNQTGEAMSGSSILGFTSRQAFSPMMRMGDPGTVAPIVVGDGDTRTLRAPWDDPVDPRATSAGRWSSPVRACSCRCAASARWTPTS